VNMQVIWTSRFKKDYKAAMKRGLDIDLLDNAIRIIASGQMLPGKYCDHQLTGNWKGYRECHIEPDWLLIYKIEKGILVLTLARTGTHSDLFDK